MTHETVCHEQVPPLLPLTLVNMAVPALFTEYLRCFILVQMYTIFYIHLDGQFRDRVFRVVGIDLNRLGYTTCPAPGINRHMYLSPLSWF